jgi:hypothetical protein
METGMMDNILDRQYLTMIIRLSSESRWLGNPGPAAAMRHSKYAFP